MRVAELWRYPVKSLRGERLQAADVDENGVAGDRLVHVRQQSGRVVTSRSRPRLLGLQGALGDDGEPTIDGLPWTSAAARELVRAAAGASVDLIRYTGGDHGQRYDVLPLTVVTESMVQEVGVDRRRFRPNVVIAGAEGLAEIDWPGYGLRAGGVLIGVRNRRSRCVMTTFDPDTLEQDLGALQQDLPLLLRPGRARLLGGRARAHRRGRCGRSRRAARRDRAAAGERGRAVRVASPRAELTDQLEVFDFFFAGFLTGGSLGTPKPLATRSLRPAVLVRRLMKAAGVRVVLRALDDRDLVPHRRLGPGGEGNQLDLVGDRARVGDVHEAGVGGTERDLGRDRVDVLLEADDVPHRRCR